MQQEINKNSSKITQLSLELAKWEEFKKVIYQKSKVDNWEGEIEEIDMFDTWFNKNCAINSIIHVNNPSILVIKDDDNEETKARNREKNLLSEEKRKVSKKIVLDHLVANCSEIYKLKEWDSIYAMVENYNRKKEQIEQSSSLTKEEELKQAKVEVAKEINKGIKASVGVEVPGLPIGLNASIEYNTQKKF